MLLLILFFHRSTNHNDIDPTVMICVSCVQHRLSGSYWIKATILPVILVSMNHSLTTIYLKDRLASEAFSGRTTVYPNPTTCKTIISLKIYFNTSLNTTITSVWSGRVR